MATWGNRGLPTTIWLIVTGVALGCVGPTEEPLSEAKDPPLHQERQVGLEGQSNFRDLGGYATDDGRTVKWQEIYRSGELPHLTEGDVARLEELELRTVVNFLLPEEIEQNGRDRLPENVREVAQPIHGERAAELTMVAQGAIRSGEFEKLPPEMNPEFHSMLLDEGKDQYAELLRLAADPANRPLAFHCSHGVHRTGTATAILLSALGVPWETVREDYLLTNEYRSEEVEAALSRIRQKTAAARGVAPDEVDMTNVEAFYLLEGSYIDGTLEQAVADYGSMEAYIREGLGLGDGEIEALRDQLLEATETANAGSSAVGAAHLRVARPTDHLDEILHFYRDGLGLEVLYSFEDHDGFDGVMLGKKGSPYHLEFTRERGHEAGRAPTAENLIVFYLPDRDEWQKAVDRMKANGYKPVPSHNPYWDAKGKTFEDIDGYRVVLQNTAWR